MFNWDEERLKNKDFLDRKKKGKALEDFTKTLFDIFCKTYNYTEDDAMLHWEEHKEDFISKIE